MKAVVIDRCTPASELKVSEVARTDVRPGWVLIRVRAFGLNHSEVLLRKFEADRPYIHTPIIPGIECVGEVADASDTRFHVGERVMALMGGMGRSFDGSYAEYVLMPESHVFAVDSDLPWTELAAIPETFYTAYGSLTLSLQLASADTLLVRGGTSTVGLAAIQLAKGIGATVIATTRSERKAPLLREIGADKVVQEGEGLAAEVLRECPEGVTKVLELIGAKTLPESLRLTARHGIVCHTGLLGGVYGLKDFDPIKEIPSGVYLTGFYSNYPRQQEIDSMMSLIRRAGIRPVIAATFGLADIAAAHTLAEERGQTGKIVVEVAN